MQFRGRGTEQSEKESIPENARSYKKIRDRIIFFVCLFICTVIGVVFLQHLSERYRPVVITASKVGVEERPIASAAGTLAISKTDKYLLDEAALLGVADNISYYFKDLGGSGEVTSLQPARSWIPASTIKAYVAVEAFRQARAGLINFDQTVVIKAQNVVPNELETDDFPLLREGTTVTIKQLVEAMITQSDNIAYNTLLDILDRRAVNSTLHDLGLTESVVGQKLNLDDTQAAADTNVPGYLPNTTTAKDLATLFDLLYSHQISGAEEILSVFKRQKINNMIPALLPENIPVAHKTGDWAPIYHDGGIIYKPQDPFILTIFTNSGDPAVLANLARVAYLRNAQSVEILPVPKATAQNPNSAFYMAEADTTKVLAANTVSEDKFPVVTASDLGITAADLSVGTKDALKIHPTLVTPNSLFYGLKRALEDIQYQLAITPEARANVLLSQSLARLGEARAVYAQQQPTLAAVLVNQSQTSLSQAAILAKNTPSQDVLLTKTKQVNDLQFATLATVANHVSGSDKEQFADTIYDLYQKNQKTVAPIINSSPVSNPTAQRPAILTVTKVEDGKITAKTDDGQTKDVLINELTHIHEFQSNIPNGPEQITTGQKIAVIGIVDKNGQIVPQFILDKIPQTIPSQIKGTVLEINSQANTLKVLDALGRQITIATTLETLTRSSQTSVSLGGIRVGSQVSVSVENLVSTPSSSLVPTASQSPSPATSSGKPNPISASAPVSTPSAGAKSPSPATSSGKPNPISASAPVSTPSATVVHAITITVTKNGSGKDEKTRPSQNKPTNSSTKPSNPPTVVKKIKSP